MASSSSPSPTRLLPLLVASDPAVRDTPIEVALAGLDAAALHAEAAMLHAWQLDCPNLYGRVRALVLLAAIYRYHLPPLLDAQPGHLPAEAAHLLYQRRFGEAIDLLLAAVATAPTLDDTLASALASAYQQLGLQLLADQVRRSVRSVRGNQWMFRCGHPEAHPLRLRRDLLPAAGAPAPLLVERTPVRMDLSHSGWSDIFFLGMDFPEGARVLNISVDLAVEGRDETPEPPIEACLRVIDEPVLRLVSVDLGAAADLTELSEVFDFGKDYLGLLKAAVIASGLIPIGMEGSGQSLGAVLERLVGPGLGLELISRVRGIPKGSRLAVSTNLLAALIAVGMRATGQTESLTGPLTEPERRLVAARAILGEWLGGSGGGWQDSGGVWPGLKVITGAVATADDPEYGIARGRLLPSHRLLGPDEVSPATRRALQESLVLVHGGMAQNVGPILEMVTERYLLRSGDEWRARAASMALFDDLLAALRAGDIRRLGALTTEHFQGPLQTMIPWCSNAFTEAVIQAVKETYGEGFWGFWMLGGMSGGGMGFIFDPAVAPSARLGLARILQAQKQRFERALPFAMDPVVYRFEVNENGTCATLQRGAAALAHPSYYQLVLPALVRTDARSWSPWRRLELATLRAAAPRDPAWQAVAPGLLEHLLPAPAAPSGSGLSVAEPAGAGASLDAVLDRLGFDREAHEAIRADLRAGRVGLAQNRLPASTRLGDVAPHEILDASQADADALASGREALARGEVAVVVLAAGAGSRWTDGAGTVKAIHPFARLAGAHRSFVEVHVAKARRTAALFGSAPPVVFTTSHLTHDALASHLAEIAAGGRGDEVRLSPGRSIGLRLVPMERDLRFAFEQTAHQVLDERRQKVRESVQAALLNWARTAGEGSDYRDNVPGQCLHPVGHAYEIPNLLLNGTLRDLLRARPALRTLLLHNIDTVGTDLDPAALGQHRQHGATATFEVIARRLDDRGGGLARVDGRLRLVEGLALPSEDDEFRLAYYNTMTTWIEIDALLGLAGLTRADLDRPERVVAGARRLLSRFPTYITLKDVKKRWGHGQEDVLPVAQFEKLWGDLTTLPEAACAFLAVPRPRGQQLKAPAQLDGWVRDGSAATLESLGLWT